jgi:PAS domain S-box-containing protein
LFDRSIDAIFTVSRDGVILDVNPAFLELFGYPRDEVIGMSVVPLYSNPSDRPRFRAKIEAEGFVKDYQWNALKKDGTKLYCLFSSSLWKNQRGEILGYQSIIHDVTDRRAAETAAQEMELRYRQLVENASDIIFQTDATGRFTLVNPGTTQSTGYSEQEIIGKHYTDLIRPDYREKLSRFYGLQFVKKIPVTYNEFPMVTKHGMTLWLWQSTQIMIEGDDVIGFQSIARDITDRKEAEDRLRQAYKLQRQLLKTAATAIFVVSPEYVITMVNDQFCSITGYEKEEVVGRHCSFICDQACAGTHQRLLAEREPIIGCKTSIRARNNSALTVLKNSSLMTDDQGNVTGVIESFVDVTDLIHRENLLKS